MTREEAIQILKTQFPHDSVIKESLETLIPELAESEDELIRKEIIDIVEAYRANCVYEGTHRFDDCLAYLEKQKEEKHATIEQVYEKFLSSDTLKSAKENKYIRAQVLWELMHNGIITEVDYQYLTDDKRKPWTAEEYRIAYQKGFEMSEQLKQKEQKPISQEDFDTAKHEALWGEQKPADDKAFEEWIDGWWKHNKVNNPDSYDKGDEIQFDEKGFKNFCRGIRNMYHQKPVECVADSIKFDEGFKTGREVGFREGVESVKPVEWKINGNSIPTENQVVDISPVEWSEEDEKLLDFWLDVIDRNDWRMDENFCKASREFISRLKSLRPSQNGCKDCPHRGDMFLLMQGIKSGKHELASEFMNYLDENRPEEKMSLSNAECKDIDKAFKECDWAKIIRYVEKYQPHWKHSENKDVYEIAYERYPINNRLVREVTKDINEDTRDGFIDGYKYCDSTHWKPSEEQMTAFRGYIEDFQARAEAAVGGWNNFDVMIRLYEQLKKLT